MTIIERRIGYQKQKQEEFASRYLETHRIPDPYYFNISNGKLVSPNTGIPIESPEVIDVNSDLGKQELEALKKIQDYANLNDSGYIIWISPPYYGVYPVSKIVISEIVYERETKKLLNRAIITDWDTVGSIIAAKEFLSVSENMFNKPKRTSDVRRNPIFINNNQEIKLSMILSNVLDRSSIEAIECGIDFKEKEKFINDYENGAIRSLGLYSESCPPGIGKSTAFQVFSGEKKILNCTCPGCGQKVQAEISGGKIKCPNCSKEAIYNC